MSYHQDGYTIQPGMLSPAEREATIAAALALGDDPVHPQPLYMPHRTSEYFLGLMRHPLIVGFVEHLLGGAASGLGSEYFFHSPGTRGFTPHQDNVWVQADPGDFIHAWIALVDVTPENGCLQFWPGSHKLGALEPRHVDEAAGEGQNPGARRMMLDMGAPGKDIIMGAGDIAFWDSLLVHGSRDNVSDRWRHSLLLSYIRKGARFNPGSKQKRVEVDLHV